MDAETSFDKMHEDGLLAENLLRGIYAYGFAEPSPIQQKAIPPFVAGGDILAQAPSGTGKTGAFVIGMLQRIDWAKESTQCLVLSPTRELAMQTYDVISQLGTYLSRHADFCGLFVGGKSVSKDLRKSGCVVVAVGTPGRIKDVIQRSALRTADLKVLVIDEADMLLYDEMRSIVYDIFQYLPNSVQVALFSSTMDNQTVALSRTFLSPTVINVDHDDPIPSSIKQFSTMVSENLKLEKLVGILDASSFAQCVIFCDSGRRVKWLSEALLCHEVPSSYLHSNLPEEEREKILLHFRRGSSRILISTDLASRGLDVQQVNLVVNYDMPLYHEAYVHRVGRSGRYSRKSIAISLVSAQDDPIMSEITDRYGSNINQLPADRTALQVILGKSG